MSEGFLANSIQVETRALAVWERSVVNRLEVGCTPKSLVVDSSQAGFIEKGPADVACQLVQGGTPWHPLLPRLDTSREFDSAGSILVDFGGVVVEDQ